MITEAALKKEIKAYLTSVGAWFDGSVRSYGRRGVPDILVCYRGRFFGIECKRPPEGKATPAADPWQQRELAAIVEAGGRAIVAWSVDHVREEIKAISVEVEWALICTR